MSNKNVKLGYKEEMKEIFDDLFRNIAWNKDYTLANRRKNGDLLKKRRMMLLERLENRRPVTKDHLKYQEEYEQYFDTKKQYDKFITGCKKLPDFQLKEDFIDTRKINLFIGKDYSIGYEKSMKLFNKIISKNDKAKTDEEKLSMHLILSNMPEEIRHPDLWFKFVMKVLDFNKNDCYKCLQRSNYARVLTAPTKEQIMAQIAYIETKIIMKDFDSVIEDPYMLCKKIPVTRFFKFTKDPRDVSTIGSRTFCCFRKGGVAEQLVQVALRSPLAATVEGLGGKNNKDTWFSYVWEMIQEDPNVEKNNRWYINLIFDNIEATSILSIEEFNKMTDIVKNSNIYRGMYCGTIRNDIKIPAEVVKTKFKKPSRLVFYDKELDSYGTYDDSRELYKMFERTDEKELTENVKKRRIDIGELNRIAYIIKLIKENNLSNDLYFAKNYSKTSKEMEFDLRYAEDDYRRYECCEKQLTQIKYDSMTRNTKIEQLDLDKSYILRNDYTIFGCELYDQDGRLIYKLYTEEELKENNEKKNNKK